MSKGYTLIELLIALVVFAILATLTSSVLYNAFSSREKVNKQADFITSLQFSTIILEQDLRQVINRAVRDETMNLIPSLVGEDQYLEFTRGGIVNPLFDEKRSTLSRVAYECQPNRLIRKSWRMLDPTDRKKFAQKVIIDNLNSCALSYIDNNLQEMNLWRATALTGRDTIPKLPAAVKLILNHQSLGNIMLYFIIPEGLYNG